MDNLPPFFERGRQWPVRIVDRPPLHFLRHKEDHFTTLARDHPHCSSNKSNEGDTRHFPAWKSFPDTCIVGQVCACSEFPGIGKGSWSWRAALWFPILLPSPRALLLVQTCNSIVKNTGLTVPTSDRCDAIEGSNAVQRAPMEGGPVC